MIKINGVQGNIEGLESYLTNGYVEAASFNDPEDDALECLSNLWVEKNSCCLFYCKKILNSSDIDAVFIKGAALDFLLLSDQWSYAFDYLLINTADINIAELKNAMFYFCCAKNESDPYPVPAGLFKKLIERYKELKGHPDAKFYHLDEVYNEFLKVYSLSNL